MSRQKLKRFAELDEFKNVAQFNQVNAKNKLNNFLDNSQEIILELACGKGDYSLALAKKYPNKKIIGVDIQGERIWYGASQALDKKLDNLFFLRMQIESLEEFFTKHTISEIWITFPDPFPRERQVKKRLTSLRFLESYKKVLIKNGLLHLKTDDENLFDYSIATIKDNKGKIVEEIRNIYKQKEIKDILKIKTDFEKKWLKAGKSIHYLKFML